MMAPTKMKLRVRKREAGTKTSQPQQRQLVAEASPDSKCPICLDRFNNVSSLDRCLHRFCFRCIHEWSKNKAECPLCKQPFQSIFHSVKAENDFKEFVLAPTQNGPVVGAAAVSGEQVNASNPGVRIRQSRATRSSDRRSRRQQTAPVQPSSPYERLEDLTEATDALDQEQGVRRMMLRLSEGGNSRAEQRNLRRLRGRDVVAFRRALYRTGVRVRNARDGSGRQRDVSAAYLRRNPACLRRLLPWLQRELMVLYGSHGSLVSVVQHIIMSRITHYDMDDSAIRDELRPFLLARTDHFLHELVSFARSTLSLEAYDQQAVYECPAPSYEEDSRSGSSIIAISEDDDDSEVPDVAVEVAPTEVPPVPLVTGADVSLSQSAWDDETPGPSYSTIFPSPSQLQVEGVEAASSQVQEHEAGCASSALSCPDMKNKEGEEEEDECMIVGYVKPMAERTPELVQLSSDSSEEEEQQQQQEATSAETTTMAVEKTEPSSSQAQDPFSPQSYLRPLSPSSCPFPSASRSPLLDEENPQPVRRHSVEINAGRRLCRSRKQHMQSYSFRSSSESPTRSGCSGSESKRGDKSRQQDRPSDLSLRRSPTVSVVSDSSDLSALPKQQDRSHSERPRIGKRNRKRARNASSLEPSSPDSLYWDSSGDNDEQSRAKERKKKRKGRDRSWSPHGLRRRETRPLSTSSSEGGDEEDEESPPRPGPPPPSLEKPAGKRKYKTRHLERAARRQTGTRSGDGEKRQRRRSSPSRKRSSKTRAPSRSPSVEIVFERQPADPQRWRRRHRQHHHHKKKRSRKEPSSPTIITIDSDSDRTADYQDCITEVTGKVSGFADHNIDRKERFTECPSTDDRRHGTNVSDAMPEVTTSVSDALAIPSLDSLLESFNPPTPLQHLSPSPLNLEHCVVDVVDREYFEDSLQAAGHSPATGRSQRTGKPVPELTDPPATDSRLLESILHDLEDLLPEAQRQRDVTETDNGAETVTRKDQSEAGRDLGNTGQSEKARVSQGSAETSAAV